VPSIRPERRRTVSAAASRAARSWRRVDATALGGLAEERRLRERLDRLDDLLEDLLDATWASA
jgi:hypothetical protein